MKSPAISETAKRNLDIVAAIVTILGIGFAIFSYIQVEKDGRVAAALSYVARFNSDPLLTYFQREYDAYDDPKAIVRSAGQLNPEPADAVTAKQVKFVMDGGFKWNAILLGDFFDQTYTCVARGICDEATVMTMLGRDIENTYIINGRYLSYLRATKHSLTGCGLDALYEVVSRRLGYSRLSLDDQLINSPPSLRLRAAACPQI